MAGLKHFCVLVAVATILLLTLDFATARCCHCPYCGIGCYEKKCKDGSYCNPYCESVHQDCNWFMCQCQYPCRGDADARSENPVNPEGPDQYFVAADLDKDGFWNMREVIALVLSGALGPIRDKMPQILSVMQAHDKDGDKKLSFEEVEGFKRPEWY